MKISTNASQRSSTAQEIEIAYFCDDTDTNEIRLRFSLRFSNIVVYARKHSKTSVSAYKAIGELSLNCSKGLDLALVNATGLSYDDILFYLPYEQLPIVFKFAYLLNCNHKTTETSIGVFAPAKDSLGADDFNAVCSRFTLDDLTTISNRLKILSIGSSWLPKIQSYLDRVTNQDPIAAKIETEQAKLEKEEAKPIAISTK